MTRLFKILKRTMIIFLSIVALLSIAIYVYMLHPKFGKAPSGARLERIQKSPNYRDGKFQNIHHTPDLTEGTSMSKVIFEFIFSKTPRKSPGDSIPSMKTDLKNLSPDQDVLVWFGHSSYFMQLDGKKILVDPVFSGNASPVPGTTTSFKGADRYSVDDLPQIDYLFLSHDHYDHVDYETLIQLPSKVNKVVCGLGVGSHLEHWKFPLDKIIEKDWYETVQLDSGFTIHITPTRHFSGRTFSRNNTLWVSFVYHTPSMRLYIGGDSGYDTHFAEIGNKYGPFDLAILENGQYDPKWRYIHLLPEELMVAAQDLKTKKLLPVHSSKFVLGNHAWDEPLAKAAESSKNAGISIITPMIGEQVNLKDTAQTFKEWWTTIK